MKQESAVTGSKWQIPYDKPIKLFLLAFHFLAFLIRTYPTELERKGFSPSAA
jgi:hypothetical protein